MTAQPKQRFIFAAFAAIQIRRRPYALSMSQLTRSPSFGPAAVPIRRRLADHRERMRLRARLAEADRWHQRLDGLAQHRRPETRAD